MLNVVLRVREIIRNNIVFVFKEFSSEKRYIMIVVCDEYKVLRYVEKGFFVYIGLGLVGEVFRGGRI